MPGRAFNQFALLEDEATFLKSKSKASDNQRKGKGKITPSPEAKGKAAGAAGVGKKPFRALVITATPSTAPTGRGRIPNHAGGHPQPTNGHVPVTPRSANGVEKGFPHHENWCGVCRLLFPTKISLQNHVKHTEDHAYYCNKCVRVFKDFNGLKNHRDNTPDHDIFCNLCLSAFDTKGGLRNHFENNYIKSDHSYACLICLEGFRTDKELDAHRKNAKKHVWCDTCQHKFTSQSARDRHWETTNAHRHCLEPGCDFDTTHHSDLVLHIKNGHFSCEHCSKTHPSATKLSQHLEKECKRRPTLSTWLAQPINNVDPEPVTPHAEVLSEALSETSEACIITCVFCKNVVKDEIDMLKHLETDKCEKYSFSAQTLVIFMGHWWFSVKYMDVGIHYQIRTGRYDLFTLMDSIKNGDIHPYICRGGCEKTFSRLSSLVYHVKNTRCGWTLVDLEFERLMEYIHDRGRV